MISLLWPHGPVSGLPSLPYSAVSETQGEGAGVEEARA